jgi:FkbM family methyltransferase
MLAVKGTPMIFTALKATIKSNAVLCAVFLPYVKALRWVREWRCKRARQRFARLCLRLQSRFAQPVFVKVGANDGITGDPFSRILGANARWKGLLIEPVPYCFERLKQNFNDPQRFILEQLAVGAPAGTATFYYTDSRARERLPGLPSWYDQLGSFDKTHILKHLDGVLEPFIIESQVAVRPLSDILRQHGMSEVHVLHIDTEGHDYRVLSTLDFTACAPVAILVEHVHLASDERSAMLNVLRANGYAVWDCGTDYFALNKEAGKRLRLASSLGARPRETPPLK